MAAAALLYSLFDAIAKCLVSDFSPFQIVFFRATFAFLPWVLWLAREPSPTRVAATCRPALQLMRGCLGFGAVTCFALAFRHLPLAMAVAIAYSAPLYTTALARPLLGERVGAARWLMVVFGFLGVLIITRPESAPSTAGVGWAVAGSMFYAMSSIANRRLGGDRATTTMFYSMIIYATLSVVALPFVWNAPDTTQWIGFAAIGIIGGIAQFFLFQAYRLAAASTVSPFEYTILAWSVVWGLLVWHEVPDGPSLVGMLMIAVAGLALVQKERCNRQSDGTL